MLKAIPVPDNAIFDVLDALNESDIHYAVQDSSEFLVNNKVLSFCVKVRRSDEQRVMQLIASMQTKLENPVDNNSRSM